MEGFKIFLYLLATGIMGGVIMISPEVSGNVVIFYVSILTTYLGIDVYSMIKSTSLMPPGEYKEIKIWRYALCSISYAVLIILGYIQSVRTDTDFGTVYSVLISALFVLIAMLIGGLEGNKVVTGKAEETKTE